MNKFAVFCSTFAVVSYYFQSQLWRVDFYLAQMLQCVGLPVQHTPIVACHWHFLHNILYSFGFIGQFSLTFSSFLIAQFLQTDARFSRWCYSLLVWKEVLESFLGRLHQNMLKELLIRILDLVCWYTALITWCSTLTKHETDMYVLISTCDLMIMSKICSLIFIVF